MKTTQLESQFQSMGARFRRRTVPENHWNQSQYAMDIQRDRQGEIFELRVPQELESRLDVNILQVRPRERHLLLHVKREDGPSQPGGDRFLCGHDEREWFVAAVPGRVSSVAQAMESLKPAEVLNAQARAGLTARQRNSRKNRAFRRQGEWFFVPMPGMAPDMRRVLRLEPIRRGSGKPHLVEYLYREGGVQVYVCREYPNGVLEGEYRRLVREDPSRGRWGWRRMTRDAAVYARGEVRHPDHRVITLPEWHQVVMNTETRSRTMQQVAFLD